MYFVVLGSKFVSSVVVKVGCVKVSVPQAQLLDILLDTHKASL